MATNSRRVYDVIKRLLDIGFALVLIILTLPIQACVAVLVATKLGRPVLFRQLRPGLNNKVFRLRKFRSMRDVDLDREFVSDEDRLTSFGRKLRSTSLDELPSLWNVLIGEMSFIGPRPLLTEYLPIYSARQARRHEVRPGLTGLAQVRGRNNLQWSEKLELDVNYVENRSFFLDAQITFQTLRMVLTAEGVSSPGQATTTKFTGEN